MTREIALGSRKYPGMFALVDDEDYESLSKFSWHVHRAPRKDGTNILYAYRTIHFHFDGRRKSKTVAMHHVVGGFPDESTTMRDHKDGNGLNNQRSNLRPATSSQNQMNRCHLPTNTSGFRGVTWHKQVGKWQSSIKVLGRSMHLGLFSDLTEAANAYDAAARKHFGEFARINFPDEVTA